MLRSNKRLKFLVSSFAAMAALVAVGVAPASAAEVSATFSGTSTKLTTTGVTIKKSGAEAKTCTLSGGATTGTASGSFTWPSNSGGGLTRFLCTGSTELGVLLALTAKYDTVTGQYKLAQTSSSNQSYSPWGNYTTASALKGVWVNGSGATNSTLTLNEALVGYTNSGGHPITMTGTFTATTSAGALLTLSH